MKTFDAIAARLRHQDFDSIILPVHKVDQSKPANAKLTVDDVLPVHGVSSRLFTQNPTYYHSGNLGDITYALYAIKENGGGRLVVGHKQNNTSPCSNPVTESQFNKFQPLLKKQAYLHDSKWNESWPADDANLIDLNVFRNHWNDPQLRQHLDINSLCRMHFFTLGILDKFSNDPWLNVPDPIKTNKIVIHRSSRYRNSTFPWAKIAARHREKLLFTGFSEEHRNFCASFGSIEFYPVSDFLEMARLIKGADAFIGNQSFPCSLALGMNQSTYQESWENGLTPDSWKQSRDCLFDRANFAHGANELSKFESWIC